jgi:hypothetical protein
MGGAWQCAATVRAEKSKPRDSPDAAATASTTGDADTPRTDATRTKGPWVVGMVLQQS